MSGTLSLKESLLRDKDFLFSLAETARLLGTMIPCSVVGNRTPNMKTRSRHSKTDGSIFKHLTTPPFGPKTANRKRMRSPRFAGDDFLLSANIDLGRSVVRTAGFG
jgi:hypothetical protein